MKSGLFLLVALLGAVVFLGVGSGVGATPPPATQCCARRELPCGDDARRLLEHRGPVRDRSGRARRGLRRGELRQQVPGRGGGLHGHRPRRHLRRGGGDRRRLPAVRADASGAAGHLARGRGRDRCLRHAHRSAAAARPEPSAAGDPRRRLRRPTWRRSRTAPAEGERDRGRLSRPPQAVLALRANDGRGCTTTLAGPRTRRAPGPGVWQPNATGLGARPVPARHAAARAPERLAVPARRPQLADRAGSTPTTSTRSRTSAASTARAGRPNRPTRRCSGPTTTSASGTTACSASPHDRGLDLMQTARMLAMAHVAGGDAMIACFDAKYHYWFWRPYQAIPAGGHRRQPGHGRRPDLEAARSDAELPRVPVGARLPQHRRRHAPWMPSSAPTRSRSRSTAERPA